MVVRAVPRLVDKSVRVKSAQPSVVPNELIAIRAYELFLEEGGVIVVSHWLRAEQELMAAQTPVRVKKAAETRGSE